MEKSKLLQALNLWREITGVDPNATSMSISSWGLKETFKALQEAIDLDPSEITANLLLGYFLNTYLAEREVSLLTLLNDPQGVAARLEKPRALMELLGRPELVEARDAFIAAIAEALEGYGKPPSAMTCSSSCKPTTASPCYGAMRCAASRSCASISSSTACRSPRTSARFTTGRCISGGT